MKSHKILIADDEPQNIKDLFEVLSQEQYRVFVVANGKEAIEQAIKHQPDAIIMDWEMPKMDGMQATKEIRRLEQTKNIPIIVATGKMTNVENLQTALETGANDYIRKPYDPIEIIARVKSMIRLHEHQLKIIGLEKEIMQQRLDELNREVETNNQALSVSKIRLINQCGKSEILIKELQALSVHIDKTGQGKLSNILSELKVNQTNINWKDFENHFEKVHPSFFYNLHKQFPDLTNNETELCTFIKLNMTSKEIMAITYKTENTLKKARQRLRKKLGLTGEDSLVDFVQNIK